VASPRRALPRRLHLDGHHLDARRQATRLPAPRPVAGVSLVAPGALPQSCRPRPLACRDCESPRRDRGLVRGTGGRLPSRPLSPPAVGQRKCRRSFRDRARHGPSHRTSIQPARLRLRTDSGDVAANSRLMVVASRSQPAARLLCRLCRRQFRPRSLRVGSRTRRACLRTAVPEHSLLAATFPPHRRRPEHRWRDRKGLHL
jgi:hypothetical protein